MVLGESPEIYGNRTFPQNFQIRKLGEISVFYTVNLLKIIPFKIIKFLKARYSACEIAYM